MRKWIFLLFLLFAGSIGYTQSINIQAGVSMATIDYSHPSLLYNEEYTYNLGFNVGVLVSFPISTIFEIQTGLKFDTKGWERTNNGIDTVTGGPNSNAILTMNASLYYIEIPVLLKENYYLKSGAKISAALGPYVGMAIKGKFIFKGEDLSNNITQTRENDVKWGDTEDFDLNRLDYGLIFNLGIEIRSIYFGLGYELGLADILPTSTTGVIAKNRVFTASIGFVFSKKKMPEPME